MRQTPGADFLFLGVLPLQAPEAFFMLFDNVVESYFPSSIRLVPYDGKQVDENSLSIIRPYVELDFEHNCVRRTSITPLDNAHTIMLDYLMKYLKEDRPKRSNSFEIDT